MTGQARLRWTLERTLARRVVERDSLRSLPAARIIRLRTPPCGRRTSPLPADRTHHRAPAVTWSDARRQQVEDRLAFNPWTELAAHRPLGSIMGAPRLRRRPCLPCGEERRDDQRADASLPDTVPRIEGTGRRASGETLRGTGILHRDCCYRAAKSPPAQGSRGALDVSNT